MIVSDELCHAGGISCRQRKNSKTVCLYLHIYSLEGWNNHVRVINNRDQHDFNQVCDLVIIKRKIISDCFCLNRLCRLKTPGSQKGSPAAAEEGTVGMGGGRGAEGERR